MGVRWARKPARVRARMKSCDHAQCPRPLAVISQPLLYHLVGGGTAQPNAAHRPRVLITCRTRRALRFSKRLYKLRWRIESAFNRLKDFRRIATRYDRLARNYLASVCLVAARPASRTRPGCGWDRALRERQESIGLSRSANRLAAKKRLGAAFNCIQSDPEILSKPDRFAY
jgi:hypothetical protein